jgi:hypothetical protein
MARRPDRGEVATYIPDLAWIDARSFGLVVIEAESIVAFNHANAGRAFRFGQDIFLAAEATRGDLSEAEYFSARRLPILDPHARARC